MNDDSIIQFGKYKGYKLANIPAWWLLWYYDQNKPLMDYIEENRELLEQEKAKQDG